MTRTPKVSPDPEQEDRFRLLRSQARDVFLFLEPDGRIADANRAAEEIYGWRTAELLGMTFLDLVPESHRAETGALLERARSGDVTAETVNRRRDGATFPVEARVHPVVQEGSSSLLAILRDISEQKATEARLFQLNRLLRTLTEIGQLVARERDLTTLLREACRVLVEHGGFRAARIELLEAEGGEGSPPVRASAGDEAGEASSAGPEAPFPFRIGERTAGFVGVRAALSAGIGGEEATLLEGLAADLGHALEAIEERAARRHAEQDLRRERDLLLRIAETSPVAITRVDASGRIDFGNRRAEEILGLSRDRMTGRAYDEPDWSITATDGSPFPPGDLPVLRVLATGQPVFDVRHSIVRPGGEKRDLSVSAAPLVDEDGTVTGVVTTVDDVTERVRAEAALREEEERLRFALEALRASEARFREMLENVELVAVTLDAHGVVTFCNDHLLRLTGWTRQEVLGAGWFARFEPGSDEEAPRLYRENVLKGGIARPREGPILTRDGEVRELLWSSTILRDAKGAPVGTASIGEDVTDRRRAERQILAMNRDLEARVAERTAQLEEANVELRRFSEEIRDLYDHAPCGYHSLDPDGLFLQVNATELSWLGYTREEVVGKLRFQDLLVPESTETFRRSFPRFLLDGEVRDLVFDLRRKDGSVFPVLLSASAVRDAEGRFQRSRSTLFDITERRRADVRIAQYTAQLQTANRHLQNALDKADLSERVKSAFLAAMSHELRTPLNSVIGFTGALLGGLVGDISPEQREALEIVQRNGRHLLDLINDVLDLSKIEAGEMRLSRQPYDLCRVVRDAIQSLGPAAEAKGLRLVLGQGPEAVPLDGDARRAAQVVLNLLTNAVKFTDRGEVTVRVFIDGEGIRRHASVAVSDTGSGIPATDLDGVFREFVQLDSGTARVQEGTGLGLALSRKLARLMGGDIEAVSARGAGSTFTFRLPLPGGDA